MEFSIISAARPSVKRITPLTIRHIPIKTAMNHGSVIAKAANKRNTTPMIKINIEAHLDIPETLERRPKTPRKININPMR